MFKSSNAHQFDETSKLALIEAVGKLEAIVSVYFNVEHHADFQPNDFYIGLLLSELSKTIKSLVDDVLVACRS